MQRGSFVSAQLVVDHNHFDLGTLGQVGRLIDGDASVFHLGFQRVHAAQSSIDCHLTVLALKSWQLTGFARRTAWGLRRTEAAGGAGPPAAEPPSMGRAGSAPPSAVLAFCAALSLATPLQAGRSTCEPLGALQVALRRTARERSPPAGGNIIHLLCLARLGRGACQPFAMP